MFVKILVMGTWLWVFSKKETADQYQRFRVSPNDSYYLCKLSISDSGRVMVMRSDLDRDSCYNEDVYETNGRFIAVL